MEYETKIQLNRIEEKLDILAEALLEDEKDEEIDEIKEEENDGNSRESREYEQ